METITHGNWQGFTGKGLSDRELEFTLAVANGATDKEIARQVGLACDSVKKRVYNAMFKLGVNRRAALVAEAMRQAIIAPLVILLCCLCAFQTFLDLGHMQRAHRVVRIQQRAGGKKQMTDDPFEFC